MKPLEFWISGDCVEMNSEQCYAAYTINSGCSGKVHVIEYSAYEALEKELEAWRQRKTPVAWLYELGLNVDGPPIKCWVVDERLLLEEREKNAKLVEVLKEIAKNSWDFGNGITVTGSVYTLMQKAKDALASIEQKKTK